MVGQPPCEWLERRGRLWYFLKELFQILCWVLSDLIFEIFLIAFFVCVSENVSLGAYLAAILVASPESQKGLELEFLKIIFYGQGGVLKYLL